MPKPVQPAQQLSQDAMVIVDAVPPIVENPIPPHCPSFDEEPWKSRADEYRSPHFTDKSFLDLTQSYPPLPSQHPYVKLILEFLDTVPEECWIDEENEVD